jgi:hypothetical protein
MSSLLPFTCVASIIFNQAPMESRETELCNKLYKTGKEQKIFLDFRILKQERKETTNKVKSFWIFQISNQK